MSAQPPSATVCFWLRVNFLCYEYIYGWCCRLAVRFLTGKSHNGSWWYMFFYFWQSPYGPKGKSLVCCCRMAAWIFFWEKVIMASAVSLLIVGVRWVQYLLRWLFVFCLRVNFLCYEYIYGWCCRLAVLFLPGKKSLWHLL